MSKSALYSFVLGAAAFSGAHSSHAQMPMAPSAPTCTAPAVLPAELASWAKPTAMKAVGKAAKLDQATLVEGQAVTLSLLATPNVTYPVRPEKPGGSVSYGGLARFTVTQAGTWRVALGSGAWVDVVKDGKAATSVAHGHGPACTGVRKMVDYALSPGMYTLQLAANGSDNVGLLVTRLP